MYGDDFKFVEPRDVKVLGQTMRSEKKNEYVVDLILALAWAQWTTDRTNDVILWMRALDIAEVCGVKLQWVEMATFRTLNKKTKNKRGVL